MTLRRTPLYAEHQRLGARFVPFAGYEMPVQYTGVLAEHQAVRTKVGLFDVSHMGEAIVEGPGAEAGLNHALTNDVSKLAAGAALYTVMCVEDGGIVDDLIVYRESPTRFFLCLNASRRADDVAHLGTVLRDFGCQLTDVSDHYAQVAVQGPSAFELLGRLSGVTPALAPFHFVDTEVAGVSGVRVARTGYTGEPGVELYVPASDGARVWQALMERGAGLGVQPCGLAARDTLRLEMKYPLYGNDIDLEHNPLEAGLGFVVKLNKGDFVGRAALQAVKDGGGPARKWVGLHMLERGIPRAGYPLVHDGREVGVVTSGTHSPSLGQPIGTGYVPAALSAVGTELSVIIRDKPVRARVARTPFYRPTSNQTEPA